MEECARVLSSVKEDGGEEEEEEGEIILYYKYVEVENPGDVCEWQKELCRRLGLTGKVGQYLEEYP